MTSYGITPPFPCCHTKTPRTTESATAGGAAAVRGDDARRQQLEDAAERGERTAANVRYGQALSEQGMGGMTNTVEGTAGGRQGT